MVESSVEKLGKVLDVYKERLSKRKYLDEDFFGLADLHHLPFVHFLVHLVEKGHLITSKKHVGAWYQRISSHHAWRKVSCNMEFPFKFVPQS